MKALVYGIYPRSDFLRREINRWERFQNVKDLRKILTDETVELESTFESYGLIYTDPLFNWNDILRPLALSMDHVNLGELRRYRETNTFYRQPVIQNYPEFIKGEKSDKFPYFPIYFGKKSIAFLPSIETFIDMSLVDRSLNREKLFRSILSVYEDVLNEYSKEEILLFSANPSDPLEISYIERLADQHRVTVKSFKNLNNTPLLKITEKLDAVAAPDYYIVAGKSRCPVYIEIIDARNTRVEQPDGLLKEIRQMGAADNMAGITTNDYLDFLPRSIADRKIKTMAEVLNHGE